MSKRPHTEYDKSDQEIEALVNNQMNKPQSKSQQDELSNHLYAIWSSDDMDKGEFEFRSQAIQSYIDKAVAQEANKARLQELLNIPFNDGRFSDEWIKEHWAARIKALTAQNKNRA